jgi:hypothetical protein
MLTAIPARRSRAIEPRLVELAGRVVAVAGRAIDGGRHQQADSGVRTEHLG